MPVHLVLAESALELVPKEMRNSSAVRSDARRRGADPSHILLDRSFHHSAMGRLKDGEKRGRPDLVHEALLSVTGTPMFLDRLLKVYVHTYGDFVLEVEEGTRLPKNYLRFRGLMEKVLQDEPAEGLIRVRKAGMNELLKRVISPGLVIGLSTQGGISNVENVAELVLATKNPCMVVGGFPHGHFTPETLRLVDKLVRIHPRPLEAHVVVARVIYEIEKTAGRAND